MQFNATNTQSAETLWHTTLCIIWSPSSWHTKQKQNTWKPVTIANAVSWRMRFCASLWLKHILTKANFCNNKHCNNIISITMHLLYWLLNGWIILLSNLPDWIVNGLYYWPLKMIYNNCHIYRCAHISMHWRWNDKGVHMQTDQFSLFAKQYQSNWSILSSH